MMNWYHGYELRNLSTKLISAKVNAQVGKYDQDIEQYSKDDSVFVLFLTKVLDTLECKLEKHQFLTGQKLIVVDIMIYCELVTILKLYSYDFLASNNPKSAKWFKEVSDMQAIRRMDMELEIQCQLWGLVDDTNS